MEAAALILCGAIRIAPRLLYSPPSIATVVLPSRCLRCGAVSREPLCAACVDYIVGYEPLWLDPALLPGPSLLDLLGPRETAVLAWDLSRAEWRASSREPTVGDAVRLVSLLRLDADARPAMSAGDAAVLHAFLGRAKRGLLTDPDSRPALAALYRYLSSQEWMPPHLASEYELRADSVEPRPLPAIEPIVTVVEPRTPAEPEAPPEDVPREETAPEEPPPPQDDVPAVPEAPEAEPTPFPEPGPPVPEPIPEPEPDIPPEPLPEPEPPLPEPEPEPEEAPPPEVAEPRADAAALGAMRDALEAERLRLESWVHERTSKVEAKERALETRESVLSEKVQVVEEKEKAVTARLVALEKDEARRAVLRFLGTAPGMTEDEADVIATAFPDMRSLEAADVKALTQCKGVSETLARAIRYELVPGEVEGEARAIELREEAQAFMEEGDYRAALKCYDRLLRERPSDQALLFDKAELLVLLDKDEDALQCYTRVLDVDRRNRQAWFERANLLFGMSRHADALDSLREGLKIDPSKSGDIILRAEQLRRDGRANDAAILLQAILDVDPANARAVLVLGDTLLELGDVDAAEGLFTRALGKDPQNPRILFRKGQLLNRKGRWGAAIQFYNRAIALQWDLADAWLAKADVLLIHGRLAEALGAYDKVVSFDAGSVAALAGRAQCLAAMDRADEARDALDRAERIAPDDAAVVRVREILAAEAPKPPEVEPEEGGAEPEADEPGSLADAMAELEEAIEAEPAEPSVRRRAKEAALPPDFKSFVEAVEPEKEDVHVLVQLAELALEGGDGQMALVRYEEAIERDAKSPDAWAGKGTALQFLERYDEALEAYDRALALRPDHEAARKWREACVRRLRREAGG